VVVSTFFTLGARHCAAGYSPATPRGKKNGGAVSGPRSGIKVPPPGKYGASAQHPGGDSRCGAKAASFVSVHAWENLHAAWCQASAGKRGASTTAAFEYRLESELVRLQQELAGGSYQPGRYSSFYIHEPKRRLISAAPFRDRVLHHALCNVIGPAPRSKLLVRGQT